ncbi:MAG: serine hydrolase, partial [Verrucomicrobia bacterium]|nr:serine hydrolase [Verrucomicrobiota bacterium]
AVGAESREMMLDILFQQNFNGMIPAGLPRNAKARVAHKTGEISTICHDAGMVFLPDRSPYVLVVLTEYPNGNHIAARKRVIANVSGAVFQFLAKTPSPASRRTLSSARS